MVRLFYATGILIFIVLAVGACSNGGDVELTLVNQNVSLNTEIANVRNTATYAADSLAVTAEYVGTVMQQVTEQYGSLSLTMVASGLDPSNVTPGAPVSIPVQPSPIQPALPVSSGTPLATGDPSSTTGDVLVTPTAPPAPSLYNIVTADGVGANDCALGSVASFSTSTPEIYVVATAANIPANTKLSANWFKDGATVVTHDFTPDFPIEQNCIWFYIDQTDTVFTPGNWSVQLAINDQPAGSPVIFTISE